MECATSCGGRASLGHNQPLGHQLEGHNQPSGHSFGHAVSRQAKVCLCLSVAVSFVCDSILRRVGPMCHRRRWVQDDALKHQPLQIWQTKFQTSLKFDLMAMAMVGWDCKY